jgi:hypothetical protein
LRRSITDIVGVSVRWFCTAHAVRDGGFIASSPDWQRRIEQQA